MKCRYITIEREYGSGGTQIARRLAAETGVPCYGTEILQQVSEERNLPLEEIERYEETVTNSILYSVYLMSQVVSGKSDMLTQEGHIYVAEQEVIRRFANAGPAIFLGHCASEALKEYSGVLNVFIRCTDAEAKKERIIEEYNVSASQTETVRRKFDKKRANYYQVNTEKRWNDFRQYDLVLDSGKLEVDGCVSVLRPLLG